MKISRSVGLIVIMLVLAGCAQKLPTHEVGYGLVAVPYHFIKRTDLPFLLEYEFKSSTDGQFSVNVKRGTYGKDVAVSEPIKEGRYVVDTLVIRSIPIPDVESQASQDVTDLSPPFVIEVLNGQIGLIPMVIKVEQYLDGDKIILKNHHVEFDEEIKNYYVERLQNMENIGQWEVTIY